MVHDDVHAADIADANGFTALATQMRDLWSHVVARGGYRRYDAHLRALRIRWAALRARFLDPLLHANFAQADITSRARVLFDWLLVGTSAGRVGLRPDDVFGEIMGWYSL